MVYPYILDLKSGEFDRPYRTFCMRAIVRIAPTCTTFELLDVEE